MNFISQIFHLQILFQNLIILRSVNFLQPSADIVPQAFIEFLDLLPQICLMQIVQVFPMSQVIKS